MTIFVRNEFKSFRNSDLIAVGAFPALQCTCKTRGHLYQYYKRFEMAWHIYLKPAHVAQFLQQSLPTEGTADMWHTATSELLQKLRLLSYLKVRFRRDVNIVLPLINFWWCFFLLITIVIGLFCILRPCFLIRYRLFHNI